MGRGYIVGDSHRLFDANSGIFESVHSGAGVSVPDDASASSGTRCGSLVSDRDYQRLPGDAGSKIYRADPASDGRGGVDALA